MNKRAVLKLGGLLVLMSVAAALGVYSAKRQAVRPVAVAPVPGMLWPNPKIIEPFTVTDHRRQEFGRQRLLAKWSFLFFGYTHCPDICPITMTVLNQAQQELQRRGLSDQVQVLFVSVDPERDDSEKLANYVNYFNPAFIGLGGSQEQIRGLTGQLGVPYYVNKTGDSENYLVDHSGSLFLTDPDGRLVAILSMPHTQDGIVDKFIRVRRFIRAQG